MAGKWCTSRFRTTTGTALRVLPRGVRLDLQSWGDGAYTLVSTGLTGSRVRRVRVQVNGGMMRREDFFGSPVVTIAVDDIDESLTTFGRLVGTTIQGKEAVGDMGFSAYFQDPEGNLMGLFQMA